MNVVEYADHLFSKLCRISRADETGSVICICCGQPAHWLLVDPAHFIGRGCMALRWDLDNVWPCHRVCHDRPDHLNRFEASLITARGKAFVENLKLRSKEYQKAPTEVEMEALINELGIKLKRYAN